MADAIDKLPEPDSTSIRQRLLVVSPPAARARPDTNLGNALGRFAEMQQLVGDQMIALEASVLQQGQQLVDLSAQLPDMKERINWLIANDYEQNQQSHALREQLARQEAGLATLTDAVRGLCEAQEQWKHTLEQLMQVLGRRVA